MAGPYPPEFRQQAVELARLREKPVAEIASDLWISDATLYNWMRQAEIDAGRRDGLTSEERAELVRLRRANRVLAMETACWRWRTRFRKRRRPSSPVTEHVNLVTEGALQVTALPDRRLLKGGPGDRREAIFGQFPEWHGFSFEVRADGSSARSPTDGFYFEAPSGRQMTRAGQLGGHYRRIAGRTTRWRLTTRSS